MRNMVKKMWNKTRKFFKDSEVIFLSYVHAVGGVVLGALTYFDWSKLIQLVQGISSKDVFFTAAGLLFFQGVVFYFARTHRAKDL